MNLKSLFFLTHKDDYNEKNFPGVVKAVNYIAKEMSYNVEIIHNKETLRDYVIAKKN